MVSAQLEFPLIWVPPIAICTAGGRPVTWTGTELSLVEPLPSSPFPPLPQHHTLPSVSSAQVCLPPASICVAFAGRPVTATGVCRSVVVPSPSWPLLLDPQQNTSP